MMIQIGDLLDNNGNGYIVRGCRRDKNLFGYATTQSGSRLIVILQPTNPAAKQNNLEFRLNDLMRQIQTGLLVHYPVKKKTPLERMRQRINAKFS